MLRRFRNRERKHRLPIAQTAAARQLREQAVERAKGARWQALVLAVAVAAVLVAYHYRNRFFGVDLPVRIGSALFLVILGWALARAIGRAMGPALLGRMESRTAGTFGFLIRLIAMTVTILVAVDLVGLKAGALVTGGAITAVVIGLAAQQTVDAAISTAVFHWIPDHDRLFERLYAALRPGGRLEAQCGGEGNLAGFHGAGVAKVEAEEPFAQWFDGWEGPWNFSSPERAAAALEGAGFSGVRCWLETRPVAPPDPREFMRVVCLGHHLDRLPEELRDPFLDEVVARAGDRIEFDYVRLNISAAKPQFS